MYVMDISSFPFQDTSKSSSITISFKRLLPPGPLRPWVTAKILHSSVAPYSTYQNSKDWRADQDLSRAKQNSPVREVSKRGCCSARSVSFHGCSDAAIAKVLVGEPPHMNLKSTSMNTQNAVQERVKATGTGKRLSLFR